MKALTRSQSEVMGSRVGTATASRAVLRHLLGTPTYDNPSSDDKVTIGWVFNTPRGPAEVRDYWWNAPTEWSIAAANRRAGLWLAKYLRTLGISASCRKPR